MLIKICGLKIPTNINELATLNIDMMGFIFYEKSPRFVGEHFYKTHLQALPKSIRKVGVFVDEDEKMVLQKIEDYGLDVVQLHGNESVVYCEKLKVNNMNQFITLGELILILIICLPVWALAKTIIQSIKEK